MVRAAFTIAFHAKHHLTRMIPPLISLFDYWVVVEGPSGNGGSTAWCKTIPDCYLNKEGHSNDGTCEWLREAEKQYPQLKVIMQQGPWPSKDVMVNVALDAIRAQGLGQELFLWEFDADEYWSEEHLLSAEIRLTKCRGDTGLFLANYFVGPDLVAKGEWGEGWKLPYRRLWKWRGQPFATHEPPLLQGGNGVELLLPERFDHLAYFFEEDVLFKDAWYSGHEGIHAKWKRLQQERSFPKPISYLIQGSWGKTETYIHRYTQTT